MANMANMVNQLLEDHLNQLKANKAANENPDEDMSENSDADEDDAKAWEGWDVESDSSEESDDGGWKNVESDGDDEKPKKKEAKLDGDATKKTDDTMAQDVPASENKKISTLATTKVC
jgi:protein SDA1